MKKYLQISLITLAVVIVFVLAFLVEAKDNVYDITYNEYKEITKSDGIVYYGNEDEIEELKAFADEKDLEIAILNPENLSKSEVKQLDLSKETIYVYEDGKKVYKYDDEITSSKLISAFAEEGLIDRTFKTITLDEYLKIIKKDGYHFMFIGSESCGYCTQFKESINESLEDYDYNVYYLDIGTLSEDDFDKLYDTDSYFSENEWGTPLNFLYKDGKRIGEINGYVETSELVKFLKNKKVV